MKYLIVYANDDGETRVLLMDEEETAEWLALNKPVVITEPPGVDPNDWPEDSALVVATEGAS
jgi:hypothetical protein